MTYWTQSPGPTPAPRPGPHGRWWVLVTVLVIAVVVEALVGLALAPRALVAVTMARYTNAIVWTPCDDDLSCAHIDAPLDWTDPASPAIQLALVEHRATGTRTGTLVVDPGGPGGSGVDMVAGDVRNAVTSTVAAHDDVIGIDPRGVGSSTAVQCGGPSALDDLLYPGVTGAVGSDAWVRGERTAAAAFARSCERHTGELLAHVDTVSAAHDLELVRRDLGVDRLDYLGYSYGTQLGSVFAGLYPHSVGRFVLDGAIDPSASIDEVSKAQSMGFESALAAYLEDCLGTDECPFSGSVDSAKQDIADLLSSVQRSPLASTDGRELGSSALLTAIIYPLYSASSWPYLSQMFDQVMTGDPTYAFFFADQYNGRDEDGRYINNQTEAFTAYNCRDYTFDPDPESMRQAAEELAEAAPIIGPYMGYGDIGCASWPYPDQADRTEIHAEGAAPIVVVGTTNDPATPYAWSQSLAEQLDSGVLVTYEGEGHTAYNKGSDCVDAAV